MDTTTSNEIETQPAPKPPTGEDSVHGLFGIRPLKWVKTKSEYWESYRANVPMGSYTVERHREKFDESKPWEAWKMKYCFDEYYDEGERECDSLKEGKAMAWKDWMERIMPALISVPNVRDDRQLPGHTAQPRNQTPTG